MATAAKLAERFPGLPVLFTSGYSADAENTPANNENASYLQKPYSPTTLARLVREILNRGKKETEKA
jgi:DNA-binding NtrC family response regulator